MAVRMPIDRFDASRVPGTKRSFELSADVGLPEPIDFPVLQIDGNGQGPLLLVFAGVHGDEYEGVDTILRLYRQLAPESISGTLLMVSSANPLAYRGVARLTPEDGKNLARVFPGNPEGSPTERIAYYLHHSFIARADFLLDLHSGGTHFTVSTLVGYYHNDETELGRKCRAAAEAFGAELLWAHTKTSGGRSISSAYALGIPCLYTEAYGGRRVRPEDAAAFYNGTLRLMRHLGMLSDDLVADLLSTGVAEATSREGHARTAGSAAPPAFRRLFGGVSFDHPATAPVDGFFLPAVALGAEVRKGQTIGTICSLTGETLHTVEAADSGVIITLPGTPKLKKGDPLYMMASPGDNR